MTENNSIKEKEEQPVLSIIQRIKDGSLNPEMVDKETRQGCVEVLEAEGYGIPAMAQIFKKCNKTIKRDLDEIHVQNALTPNIELAKKLIGETATKMRNHCNHLMRLARTPNASVSEKAQAEYYAARVWLDGITKLQSLGYLPTQPQAIVGDIFHHNTEGESTYEEISNTIIEVENIVNEIKIVSPETHEEIEKIKRQITKAEIEGKVKKLEEKIKGVKDEE